MRSVRMTRKVVFSSGHRYWLPSLSSDENRSVFGRWASPFNHGHNYRLDVTVSGVIDAATGMIVNIKRVDDILKKQVLEPFDGHSINDEIPAFLDRASCIENLLDYLAGMLSEALMALPEVHLEGLRLEELPTFWGELNLDMKQTTLTRVYEFAASHRLDAPTLSHEENLSLFGKCNNPAGHGHNYVLEVTVTGEPDPRTGMTVDLGELDSVVQREVLDHYDHKNLNVDVPELVGRLTTSEVVAGCLFDALEPTVPGKLVRVRLHETARNMFEVSRSS